MTELVFAQGAAVCGIALFLAELLLCILFSG